MQIFADCVGENLHVNIAFSLRILQIGVRVDILFEVSLWVRVEIFCNLEIWVYSQKLFFFVVKKTWLLLKVNHEKLYRVVYCLTRFNCEIS